MGPDRTRSGPILRHAMPDTDVSQSPLIHHLSWREVHEIARAPASLALLPVGATEQHGEHLPLGTDTIMVEELCKRAATGLPGVAVAPAIPFGESHNHIAFAGTLTLSLDTLKAVVCEIGLSLFRSGFQCVFIVNGHGGNTQTLAAAALELRQRSRHVVAHTMWTALVDDGWTGMESAIIWHADESETSTMLAVAPELVRMERAVDELPPDLPFFEFTEEALLNVKIDLGLPATHALTRSGSIGEPRLARAEKGEPIVRQTVQNLRQTILELQAALPALEKVLVPE
jgi:creatinine amidohydrolase